MTRAPVAQWIRVAGFEPVGRKFESCRAYHYKITDIKSFVFGRLFVLSRFSNLFHWFESFMTGIIVRMEKLTEFKGRQISFVETMHVKEGVICDVYSFIGDTTRDLGIVTVRSGHSTPLQRVLEGTNTIEGHLSGSGSLTVGTDTGEETYSFDEKNGGEVSVKVGQIVQWTAAHNSDLIFYEICEPPYQDGRFENLD